MYFRDIYKPLPLIYNLVLAMLWRHPENVEFDKIKVAHYCAAVSISNHLLFIYDQFYCWVWLVCVCIYIYIYIV